MWGDEETERRWREAVERERRDRAQADKDKAKWTPAYGSGGGGGKGDLCLVSFLVFLFLVMKPLMGFKA